MNDSLHGLILRSLNAPVRHMAHPELEHVEDLVLQARERWTETAQFEKAEPLFRQALAIQPHRADVLMQLVEFAAPSTNVAYALAKRIDDLAESLEHQERHLTAIRGALALYADRAGRYQEANRIRRTLLSLDPSDGGGHRYFVCAYALMVGDLATVKRWLRWMRKNDQIENFWCWVDVLYQLLLVDGNPGPRFARALRIEPNVPHMLITPDPPAAPSSYVVGSLDHQRITAAVLWRAWAVHPEARAWLQAQISE